MKSPGTIVWAASLLLAAGTASQAQNQRIGLRFEKSQEATFHGTVEEVRHIVRRGLNGIQIVVKTDTGRVTVHLGPQKFLSNQNLALSKNDVIDVTAWKVNLTDATLYVARQVTRANTTCVLRTESGAPLWRRARFLSGDGE